MNLLAEGSLTIVIFSEVLMSYFLMSLEFLNDLTLGCVELRSLCRGC